MARKEKMKGWSWLMFVVSIITSVAIGGLFTAGTFLNVPILKYLPLIFHQVLGWFIIVIAIWGLIYKVYKAVK